jgi:hypothetical protein
VTPISHWFKNNYLLKNYEHTDVDLPEEEKGHNSKMRLKLTLLFFCQLWLGMTIMLICMSFNGWAIASLLLGASVGYFLFESGQEDPKVRNGGCCG